MTRSLTMAALVAAMAAGVHAASSSASGPDAKFVWLVVREDCWDTFFTRFDLLNVDCLKASISKSLGYAIIAGSVVVKVPQVLNILKAGSVEGISSEGTYMELLSSVLAAVWHIWYGSKFSSYGESIIVALGTLVVVLLLWAYRKPGPVHIAAWTALFGAATALGAYKPAQVAAAAAQVLPALGISDTVTLSKRLTGTTLLDGLQYGGGALFAFSRLSQIAAIATMGGTGTLAILTLLMNFAGTAARVFTSAQEVGNPVQLATAAVNAMLNGTLVLQYVWYNWLGGSKGAAQGKEQAKGAQGQAKETKKTK